MVGRILAAMLCLLFQIASLRAGDQKLRDEADRLAAYSSYYGMLLREAGIPLYIQDPATFRKDVAVFAQQMTEPETLAVAKKCAEVPKQIDTLGQLSRELVQGVPAPEMLMGRTISEVLEASSQGAFKSKDWRYDGWDRAGNPRIREIETDGTLAVLFFETTLALIHDQHAAQLHQEETLKHRIATSRKILAHSDVIQQERLKAAEELAAVGFRRFAGPEQPDFRLDLEVGRNIPEGPIAEWKQRLEEQKLFEKLKPGEDLPVVVPEIRIRNPGPTLHRVALTVDYLHHASPQTPVMRQVYFVPEWGSDVELAVTDAFCPNLDNRNQNELRESLFAQSVWGHSRFPGFQGIIGVRYSLSSQELRQDNVSVELISHRDMIRDEFLAASEELAFQLLSGDLAKSKGKERQEYVGLSQKLAQTAVALADPQWPKLALAKGLSKDYRQISKRIDEYKSEVLEACRPGMIYLGESLQGKLNLEFGPSKPSHTKIEAVLQFDTGGDGPTTTKYQGRIVPAPYRFQMQLHLAAVPDKPTGGKKSGNPGKANENPPAVQPGMNTVRAPESMVLLWQNDRWVGIGFELLPSGQREIAGNDVSQPADGKTPQRGMVKALGDPRIPVGSEWEGSRKITDADGKTLSEEKFTFTVKPPQAQGPDLEALANQFLCDIAWTGAETSIDSRILIVRDQIRITPGYVLVRGAKGRHTLLGQFVGKNSIEYVGPAATGGGEMWVMKITRKK